MCLLQLRKSNSKVHVFNVLMVLFQEFHFAVEVRSLSPCAVSYSTYVLSDDTVSQSMQHVCKRLAKSVKSCVNICNNYGLLYATICILINV